MIRKTILRGLCLRGLWLYCIAFSSLAIGAIHEVKDGESIQAAVAKAKAGDTIKVFPGCLLYTSPSPRDLSTSRMPSSA